MALMQLLEAFARHVGVYRGGGDVRVAEQKLHDAEIGAVVEQMSREGVPQRVRRQRRTGDARAHSVALDQLPKRLAAQRTAASGEKYRGTLAGARQLDTRRAEIALEPSDRFLAHRHQSLLA